MSMGRWSGPFLYTNFSKVIYTNLCNGIPLVDNVIVNCGEETEEKEKEKKSEEDKEKKRR